MNLSDIKATASRAATHWLFQPQANIWIAYTARCFSIGTPPSPPKESRLLLIRNDDDQQRLATKAAFIRTDLREDRARRYHEALIDR
jgi:hypothetical protein